MSEDAGAAGGFQIASAFVQVDPDAASFEEQLDAQIGALQYVVKVPVVPDTGDFAGEVDTAVAESKSAVTVPVVPDTEGFQLLIDNAVEQAKASVTVPVVPDAAGFPEAVEESVSESEKPVTVPVVPDMTGFTEEADTEAGAAGDEAGATFADRIAAAAEASGLSTVWPSLSAGAAPAGEEAGAAFGGGFAGGAEPGLAAILNAWSANIILPAGEAGEEAGAAFASRFSAAAAAVETPVAAMAPAAEAEAEVAGEEAGAGFFARFSGALGRMTAPLAALVPGMAAEGEEAGASAGEGFMAKLKGVIAGDIPILEVLLGAAFVAATADMASKFQAAMELVHTQAGVAQSAISGLSGSVLTLAGKVGVSPDSLAQALYHVESSFQSVGISGARAMQLVQIAAEGARTGNANLVDVTNALDAVIVSGIGGIQNYGQAMGVLNGIVGTGDMTMQDLADAMGTGLMAVAKSYGQSIYEVGAALATFGDNNIRGAKAATDLRMAMQAIAAPLSTAGAALSQLGLTQTSLYTEMTQHGLTAAIQMFVDRLEASKVPISDWGQYATEIFGKRAGVGIQVLMDQLDRLKGKMPDLEKSAHGFGSAWAATQQTTSQKLHELEAGFEALMIRIGDGLLPAVNSFLSMIVRNLPAIEHFGTGVAHLVAPVVKVFFTGLEAILKVLFGRFKDVTIAAGGLALAFVALNALDPFGWVVLGVAAFATLTGAIIKYHKEILDTIHKYWHEIEIFLASVAVAFPVLAMFAALTAAIIKYHKQIWDAIKETWDKVRDFFTDIAKDIIKTFDDVKKEITGGFDAWWKSHGEEIEKAWKVAWTVIKDVFQVVWDVISTVAKIAWADVEGLIETGLDVLAAIWKVAWDAMAAVFKVTWDLLAATAKIAWDVLVGIFDVFLDLITGHWSKAWTDIQNTATQVWNAVKAFLAQVWNAIASLADQVWHDIYDLIAQVVNNIKSFLVTAWDDIKNGVVSAFDDMRNDIRSVWDGILHDIESVVDKIKSLVGDITGLPGKALHAIGGALGDIGLASGGVLPGYAPGHDSVKANLSPGEAVLVPEAVRAIGPDTINAISARYSAGRRGYSGGGVVPGFAAGGVAGLSPYQAGAAAGQMYAQAYETQPAGGNVNNFYLTFNGPRPDASEWQAIQMKLAAAVGIS